MVGLSSLIKSSQIETLYSLMNILSGTFHVKNVCGIKWKWMNKVQDEGGGCLYLHCVHYAVSQWVCKRYCKSVGQSINQEQIFIRCKTEQKKKKVFTNTLLNVNFHKWTVGCFLLRMYRQSAMIDHQQNRNKVIQTVKQRENTPVCVP